MTGNKAFILAYANAIVERLWLKGLISEDEKNRLYEKNTLNIIQIN